MNVVLAVDHTDVVVVGADRRIESVVCLHRGGGACFCCSKQKQKSYS